MLNHIVIMGRLTRDPELRYTQTQTPVASFTLAVDRDFGGKERATDFINCTAWRNSAEFVSKYFKKGNLAVVSGRLQIREWNDREGNKRTTAEVVAENVYFGESKRSKEGGNASADTYGGQGEEPRGAASSYGSYESSYNYNRGYGDSSSFNDIPAADSAFAELDDGDGELPF